MKAAVLYGNDDIRYEDVETPEPSKGQVRVRVKACGICGSDIPRVTDGGAHFYPIVLGHEFSGYIDKTGEGVTAVKEGDRIAAVPLVPCMQCDNCRHGLFSLCKNYIFIGSRVSGGFADFVVLPETNAVRIDDSVSYEQGALFEPSSVAHHGVSLAKIKEGSTAAVLGGGTIGAFVAQWARIKGASKVVVFGRNKQRLKINKRIGADVLISTNDDDWRDIALAETKNGRGFDVLFDTAGTVPTMKTAMDLAADRATVCYVGTPSGDITFSKDEWERLNRKELTVTASWMSGGLPYPGADWTETAEKFRSGELMFDTELFYAKYDMCDAGKAFKLFKEKGRVKGRVLLVNKD